MKEIQLSRGMVTQVDDEDYKYLNQWKWSICDTGSKYYAVRREKNSVIFLHRFILGYISKGIEVDHIDSNGLNNQRNNLRLCTRKQNCMNSSSKKNTTSIYKGVHWHKINKVWRSQITVDEKVENLGCFTSEVEAAKAYDNRAFELFGEFAKLNIKD